MSQDVYCASCGTAASPCACGAIPTSCSRCGAPVARSPGPAADALAPLFSLATSTAAQTVSTLLTQAWRDAGDDQRRELGRALLSWAALHVDNLPGVHQAASTALIEAIPDVAQLISDDERKQLAQAILARLLHAIKDDRWESRDLVRQAMQVAAARELAAAQRVQTIETLAEMDSEGSET